VVRRSGARRDGGGRRRLRYDARGAVTPARAPEGPPLRPGEGVRRTATARGLSRSAAQASAASGGNGAPPRRRWGLAATVASGAPPGPPSRSRRPAPAPPPDVCRGSAARPHGGLQDRMSGAQWRPWHGLRPLPSPPRRACTGGPPQSARDACAAPRCPPCPGVVDSATTVSRLTWANGQGSCVPRGTHDSGGHSLFHVERCSGGRPDIPDELRSGGQRTAAPSRRSPCSTWNVGAGFAAGRARDGGNSASATPPHCQLPDRSPRRASAFTGRRCPAPIA